MFNIPKCMTMFNFPKCMIFNCVRTLASRKHGPFRKVPHLPIKGPRDFDYWKRLKRKGLGKKEHRKENTYRTNELRKRRPRPAKKKCEEPPIKDQEEGKNPKKC